MKPRVTVCVLADGSFEILMNEAGRDLMVEEMQRLNHHNDHFHLDHYDDPDLDTDVALSGIPYRADDKILEYGKILLRPDEWDLKYFPHVLAANHNEEGTSS